MMIRYLSFFFKKMSDRSFIPYKRERERETKACELGMKSDAPRLFFKVQECWAT